MKLDPDGAQLFSSGFAAPETDALACLVSISLDDRPGARLGHTPALADAIRPATAIAASFLGPATRPVRATLFDKSPALNWALGWHQDRTIAVRKRIDCAGFMQWTIKHGIVHTVPPFGILERMLTLRIHLDPVGPDNAPLMIVPGSHRLGPIAEPSVADVVERLGTATCLADAGDIWVYRTPILHASARATLLSRRRVLQVLFSAEDLPGGLDWLGV